MNDDLNTIWILGTGSTVLFLAALQLFNLALTLFHSLQEKRGRLWRYFGAIAGVRIQDGFGLAVFFSGLTLTLWIVGLLGIAGAVLWQKPLAFGCLGAIVGCRLSDSFFSHIRLNARGFRPNPGLSSVPLYFLEAAILIVVFYPAIVGNKGAVATGFILACAAFYGVIPILRGLGRLIFAPIEPWQPGTPQPEW